MNRPHQDTRPDDTRPGRTRSGKAGSIGMYRRAMLRAYAESAGLDSDAAVEPFERTFEEPPARPQEDPPAPAHTAPASASPLHRDPRSLESLLPEALPPFLRPPDLHPPDLRPPGPTPDPLPPDDPVELDATADPSPSDPDLPALDLLAFERAPRESPDPLPTRRKGSPAVVPRSRAAARARQRTLAMTAALLLAIPIIVVFGLWGGTGEPDGLLGDDVVATAFAGGEAGRARQPAEASAALAQPRVAAPGDSDPAPAPAAVPERPPAPPVATAGRLVVESEPAGANVTVNGIGWGATPVTIRYLPFGEKRVRVTMPGYRSQERVVRLGSTQASATVRITLGAVE